jgi:hypothetical protein
MVVLLEELAAEQTATMAAEEVVVSVHQMQQPQPTLVLLAHQPQMFLVFQLR